MMPIPSTSEDSVDSTNQCDLRAVERDNTSDGRRVHRDVKRGMHQTESSQRYNTTQNTARKANVLQIQAEQNSP